MRRTVAFFDVLGFRNLLAKQGAQVLGARYARVVGNNLEALRRPLLTSPDLPTLFPGHGQDQPWCMMHVFSDSIIFMSHDDSDSDCRKVLVFALRAMQMLIATKLPVRGGVAFDELFVDVERQIFLGRALTTAYELEQNQEWIGAGLDPSIENAFPDLFAQTAGGVGERLFPLYEIPLKTGDVRQYRTINWRWNLVVKNGTRSLFDVPDTWPERRKVDNTLAYARHIRSAGLAYPESDHATPLEVRSFFVSDGVSPPSFAHGDDL
jgi:hypothetical protein